MNPGNENVPYTLVSATLPVEPLPTTAVILVGDTIVKLAAGVPPKLTLEVPVKFCPLMVTNVPALPDAGVKAVIAGIGGT